MEQHIFREIVEEVCTIRLSALGLTDTKATDHGQKFASDRVFIEFSNFDGELWIEFGILDPAMEYFGYDKKFSLIDIAALENLKEVDEWNFIIEGADVLKTVLKKCLILFNDTLLPYVKGNIEYFKRLSFYSEVLHLHYNFRVSNDYYKQEYVKRIIDLASLGFKRGYYNLVVLTLEYIHSYLGAEELELLGKARKLSAT